MGWFRKKKIFCIHYLVHNLVDIECHYIVKAIDIAEATKKCQRREINNISILDWEVLN